MSITRTAPVRRTLAATLTSALVAGAAIVGFAAPAQAAEADVSNATLDWGLRDTWRSYITGPIASGTITPTSPTTVDSGNITHWTGGEGTLDDASLIGSADFTGAVTYYGHDGSLDMTLSNASIEVTSSTSATLYLDVTSKGYSGFPETDEDHVAFATFALGTPTVEDGVATWTDAAGTFTDEAKAIFGGMYNSNPYTDPVTFSLPYSVATTATSTSLAVSPAGTAQAGDDVTLTATVSPAVAGTVTFSNGSTVLGTADVDGSGVATLTTSDLAVGTASLTAAFAPSDAAYEASVSDAVSYTVTEVPAPDAIATTTSVAVASPATRAVLGDEVTLTSTVAAASGDDVPAGSVEFFSIADGTTDRVSLGSSDVDGDGVATLATTALTAGGHTFAAVFTPTDSAAFAGSEGALNTNYGIVDDSQPSAYEPGADAVVSDTPATATWSWNAYSSGWTKVASGDVAVDGQDFVLSDGVVTADEGGAKIEFTGTLRTEAYTSFFPANGQWIELVDPALHISADGTGVWVAGVRSGAGDYSDAAEPVRVVVGSISGSTSVPGSTGEQSFSFDYAGTVASGTWSKSKTDAWSNAFILQAPAAILSFYYASGASGDVNKAPADLTVDFDWPAASETTLAVSPATRAVLGDDVTLTATVGPDAAQGSVEFFDGETSLGTAEVSDGTATLTTDELAAGGHVFSATFTSSNGYDASSSTPTSNYGIVDTAVAEVEAPTDGEHVSGVTANWSWSAYADGWTKVASGDVSVDGQDFVLENGTGIVGDDATVIDFTGTLRVEAYTSFFPANGQWVELVDPTLTIAADGSGTWTAGVRSGAGDYDASADAPRTVVATFSGAAYPDFSQDAVDASIAFDYAGTTAAGTWSAGRTDAWTNAFILQVPSAIVSFYYASGASGDVNKAPAELSLSWTAPTPAVSVEGGATEVEQGAEVVFAGTGFRDGESVSAVVNSEPVDLGTQVADASGAVSFTWTVPADFELGDHTIVLTGERSGEASFAFSVVETAAVPGDDDDSDDTTTDDSGTDGSGTADTDASASGTLPRTGGELSVLWIGAALLLVAAGSVLVARRRQTLAAVSEESADA